MPSYIHPSLLWGLGIAAVPVLIHLINLLRHRRVEWAAMEFLLVSQKRHRTRILFKQLLLLLMRIAVIAAVVLLLAQPVLRDRLGRLFGGRRIHHLVLLDDSFSMSDRWAESNAMSQAKRAVLRIGTEAARQTEQQTFTLMRFSQAGGLGQTTQPDLQQAVVDTQFGVRLKKLLEPIKPSDTSAGPEKTLEAARQLVDAGADTERIVYVVSDFRARQWAEPGSLRDRLLEICGERVTLHLVNCIDQERPNLAITVLEPAGGTMAAGVPLEIELGVHNFDDQPARDVTAMVTTNDVAGRAVRISEIPAGKEVRERFFLHLPTAGEHRLTVRLQDDAVLTDNSRHAVLDLPDEVAVLLIDGGIEQADARYLSAALNPGGSVTTGIRPRTERPRFVSLNALDGFSSIYLLNVDRLDASAIEALEHYVAAGGGLGFFVGDQTQPRFVNESLYRDGQGVFPLPLAGPNELLIDRLERAGDLQPGDHPIFRVLDSARKSFLETVRIERYMATNKGWREDPELPARVIARLRNKAPVVVERRFGKGRVVAFLTTAAPDWNNWARANPSFVVTMLELQAYLARRPSRPVASPVTTPLAVSLDPALHRPEVQFTLPDRASDPVSSTASTLTDGSLEAVLVNTSSQGLYQVLLRRTDGSEELRHRAYHVEPTEGDLAAVNGEELAEALDGIPYQYHPSGFFEVDSNRHAGYNLALAVLLFLVVLLIAEQLLAYSISYHPPASKRRRQGVVR